jgi:glycosyltransferase involved in cell wall biosynthesis
MIGQPMNAEATVLIAARNAASTIERALLSVVAQGPFPIVMIDDFSCDETVRIATNVAGSRLRVIRPPRHQTLGLVRQIGLESVETPYGIWLDSDDELLPGRIEQMVRALENDGGELVSDGVELFDGKTGTFRTVLPIPDFLRGHHPLARLFERNYLPGAGVIGFCADFAKRIGYDPLLHGPEDIDFILRAVKAGARICLLESIGYRLYAYPQSISRQIDNQRRMYRNLLRKHSYEDVRILYTQAGHDARIAAWGLVSMALFREDYARALDFLTKAQELMENPGEVLEPGGPCPMPENWRLSFHRGTILLLMGKIHEAVCFLENAEEIRPTAEGANNLGVAFAKTGDLGRARMLFACGLERYPQYFDAKMNLDADCPSRITTHPIRSIPSRSDYSAHSSRDKQNPLYDVGKD